MPIDPHAKRLLDMLAAAGTPDFARLSPTAMRQSFCDLARMVDAADEPIGRVDNIVIPGPAGELFARVYTPIASTDEAMPALVYFHGGAWVFGELDTHEGTCRILADEAGCRVVSVEYRLAPEHRFPAAVEDAYAATRWVAEHVGVLAIDPARLGIAGDSAGATLVAAVCQLASKDGPDLALQVLLCPVMGADMDTDSRRTLAQGYFIDQAMMRWAFDLYRPLESEVQRDPRMFPLAAADFRGLPPAHVHTAEFDPLRDEGKLYADRLAAAGVPVQYTCHPGMVHHFYGMVRAVPKARTALQRVGAAVRAAMTPASEAILS